MTSLAVWDKQWIGPSAKNQLRPLYEMILFCARPDARIPNRSAGDIFRCKWMSHLGSTGHPAEKPVALLVQIVTLIAPAGAVVLDPFMGSGSTGVAALQSGRRFVGIEVDPHYFEIACARIRAAAGAPPEGAR